MNNLPDFQLANLRDNSSVLGFKDLLDSSVLFIIRTEKYNFRKCKVFNIFLQVKPHIDFTAEMKENEINLQFYYRNK